jgi:glycosyltransferase involved in cell wall biosynthesis
MPRREASHTVERLSGDPRRIPRWSLAIFAHNEARRIRAALASIAAGAGGYPVRVVVLANGCTDRTCAEVRLCSTLVDDLQLVHISLADKANAWNIYVHDLSAVDEGAATDIHFFTDGDVRLEPDALPLLASAFAAAPTVDAVGGMPTTGRDRDAWRDRMARNASLAGNLYALGRPFVTEVRRRGVRMPVGLMGEDLFVSWLVDERFGEGPPPDDQPRCVFHTGAGFAFDSLAPWRARDYRTYFRRQWRYALRAVQHEMLVSLIRREGIGEVPHHIEDVYRRGPIPSRLRWIGRLTGLRLLAVQWVRRCR